MGVGGGVGGGFGHWRIFSVGEINFFVVIGKQTKEVIN